MKQLTSATFHDFNKEPIFVGIYVKDFLRKEDDLKDKKNPKRAGDIMGFVFSDDDGNEVIIGASATVENIVKGNPEKEIPGIAEGEIIGFKFEGKGLTKTKREFNKFSIHAFETFEEANEFYTEKSPQ